MFDLGTSKSVTSLHIQTSTRNVLHKKIFICVCAYVHFLVTMSFAWRRKIKCYLCFQQCIKTICRKIYVFLPDTGAWRGTRLPREAFGFVLDTEQCIFFSQVSFLTEHSTKHLSAITLLWIWRGCEFCWLVPNLKLWYVLGILNYIADYNAFNDALKIIFLLYLTRK